MNPNDNPIHHPAQPAAAASAWRRICLMTDACAMGPLLAALHCSGLYHRLAQGAGAPSLNALAGAHGLPAGLVQWAGALMEGQGLADRHPVKSAMNSSDFSARLTPAGHVIRPHLDRLDTVDGLMQAARRLRDGDWRALRSISDSRCRLWDGLTGETAARIFFLGASPLMAVLLHRVEQSGLLMSLDKEQSLAFCAATLQCAEREAVEALTLMRRDGWLTESAHRQYSLTPAGRQLSRLIAPLQYVVCYLDTLCAIPALFTGGCADPAPAPEGRQAEIHVDRRLDVALSGEVYRKNCRAPLREIVLPIFATPALDEQPQAIVDTGAGDAALLIDLYREILAHTLRGRHIRAHPLQMVAVEYNEVARAIAAQRLAQAGIPGFAMFGDIADPNAIIQALGARGIQPSRVLHISKSVFHNRRYQPPVDTQGFATWQTASQRVYMGANGRYITAREAQWNLVECLRRWRAACGRHGLVIIEAHGADPRELAPHIGRNILTTLEATHGLSHQMLVSAADHRRALQAAGFQPLTRKDIARALLGQPLMTIDHWAPA